MTHAATGGISIVIPTYNCASFLERAVASAFGFCTQQITVIVVNDGSTDSTAQVLRILQRAHPNLEVISQPNAGLSAARNAGLAQARGDYVVLLDADDELIPIPHLGELLQGVDMLRFGLEEVAIDGQTTRTSELEAEQLGASYLAEAFRRGQLYPPSVLYVYRRSFLLAHGLRFMPGLLHEDMLFTVQALMAAERFKAVPDIGYRYLRRPGSITEASNSARILRRMYSLRIIERIVTENANRRPELDLGWWSLHVLEYAYNLAIECGSREARWLEFRMLLGFCLRYRRWGRYRNFRDVRPCLRRSVRGVVGRLRPWKS